MKCIPFIRAEVEESAWGYEERYRQKQDIVVGVNEYVTDQVDDVEILQGRPEVGATSRSSGSRSSRRTATSDGVDARARGAAPGVRRATGTCSTRCAPR